MRQILNRQALRPALLVGVPAVVLVAALLFWLWGGRYVTTENAYVKADKIAISTDVSGRVTKVNVQENQIVKQGDILFEIDREPFQIALEKAEAQLHSTRNEIDSMRALAHASTASWVVAGVGLAAGIGTLVALELDVGASDAQVVLGPATAGLRVDF